MTLRSQMLDESISKRPNIIQVVRYFENKKKQKLNDFLLLISLKLMSSIFYYFSI